MSESPLARVAGAAALGLVTLLLAACGAQTKTGSNGTGNEPPVLQADNAFVTGALTGAEPFAAATAAVDLAGAALRVDSRPDAGSDGLRLGMVLEAAGTSAAGATVVRVASVQSVARGAVAAVDADNGRFTVATLAFVTDTNTLFDGVAGMVGLVPGDTVEVSGLPLAASHAWLATRVTRLAPQPATRLELAAPVDQAAAGALVVAGVTVPLSAPVAGAPAVLVGSRVRVAGTLDAAGATLTPSHVEFLPDYPPTAGARVAFDGIVLATLPAGGVRVRTASRDLDVTGMPADAALPTAGSRVTGQGTAQGAGAVVADAFAVIAPGAPVIYRVTGSVSDFASLASLRVRGEPVDLTTAVITGGDAAGIGNGRRLAVTGTAGPGAIRASAAQVLP